MFLRNQKGCNTYKVKLGNKTTTILFIGKQIEEIFDYYKVDYEKNPKTKKTKKKEN